MVIEHNNDFKEKNRSLEQEVTLEVGDVEIGAVEIKDGETDDRASVVADGDKKAVLFREKFSSIGDGRKTISAAGTAEALVGTATPCKKAVITALAGNTDTVVVGASTVVAALATRRGTPIEPGDSFWFPFEDLADVYIDSEVNGEGVSFTYFV